MPNYAAGGQLVEVVPYRMLDFGYSILDLADGSTNLSRGERGGRQIHNQKSKIQNLHAFAKDFREEHQGQWQYIDRLGGLSETLQPACRGGTIDALASPRKRQEFPMNPSSPAPAPTAGPESAGTADSSTSANSPVQHTGSFGSDATVQYIEPPATELADTPGVQSPRTNGATPAETIEYTVPRAVPVVDPQAETARKEAASTKHPGPAPDGIRTATAPTTLFAGYELLDVLGRGGMGVVYKARQVGLNRLVALKMILSGVHADADELERFRLEAEAVAHLQHPGIVQIYEVGEEDGRPFFSLEFVEGQTLSKKIQDAPLSPREAAGLVQQLARTMGYAHSRGIIHRDLKPANVLLTPEGMPKISDFGLAKRLEDAGQTRTGTVLGTPSYMAPEQTAGNSKVVGPLSDVYALGAILYDLLTGRAPFRGTTILDTLEQVRVREPVPPVQLQPGVPRDLETICLKCLQKDPARRYATATALADDLGRFLEGVPILARPVGRVERLWRWCQRNPRTAGLAAGIMLLLVAWAVTSSVLAGLLKAQKEEAEQQKEEAERQTELAVQSDKNARRQASLARANEERAQRETALALDSEKRAKDAAGATVNHLVGLGEKLQKRLDDKRLAVDGTPEVKRLREDLLVTLRNSLGTLSKEIERLGVSPFAQAATSQAMGDLLARLGQGEEALRVYRQGYEAVKRVADANPKDDLARGNLGVMLLRLGNVALDVNGDARSAHAYYKRARDLHRAILAKPGSGFFKEIDLKRLISHDDIPLGRALLAAGQPAAARTAFQEALDYRLAWSSAEPENNSARSYVMEARMWLGVVAGRLDDAKAVEKQFTKAIQLGVDFVRQFPKAADFKEDLADVHGHYGDALLRLGKKTAAEKSYQDSLASLETSLALKPDELSPRRLLARTHERLGIVSTLLGKTRQAEKHYRAALKLAAELVEAETNSPARQVDYAVALARAGKCTEALARMAKVKPRVEASTQLQLQLARGYALCAAQQTTEKANHVARAMVALRAAVRADFKDVFVLQTDPDLAVLRADSGFQALLAAIKAH